MLSRTRFYPLPTLCILYVLWLTFSHAYFLHNSVKIIHAHTHTQKKCQTDMNTHFKYLLTTTGNTFQETPTYNKMVCTKLLLVMVIDIFLKSYKRDAIKFNFLYLVNVLFLSYGRIYFLKKHNTVQQVIFMWHGNLLA